MAFLITTTGLTSSVIFEDLGMRIFDHPTTNFNLEDEYSIEDIWGSNDVNNSLLLGYITSTYNGVGVTSSAIGLEDVVSCDYRLFTQNEVRVKKNPGFGEFSSIKDAVDSITTASFASQWVIRVGPGLFIEDTITMKPYLHIVGSDRISTIIEVDNPSKHAVIGRRTSSISDCSIQGATSSGYAAIYFSNDSVVAGESYAFIVDRLAFGANNILIHNVGTSSAPSSLVASEIIKGTNTGDFVQGFVVDNVVGGLTTTITLKNSQLIASTITEQSISISGTLGQVIVYASSISRLGSIAQTAVRIKNGGSFRAIAADIRLHAIGILLESGGTAPIISAVGVNMTLNTQDIVVDHPGASGLIDGVFDRIISYINPASTVVLNGLDRRIIRVAKLDTDYNSVKNAIDNITDASVTNRYVVSVGPGIFDENPFTLKPYIEVVGAGSDSTFIRSLNPSLDFITTVGNATLKNLKIGGSTDSGKSIFIHTGDSIGGNFIATNCSFTDTDIILTQTSTSGPSIAIFSECSFDATSFFTVGFYVQDSGTYPCLLAINGFSWFANDAIVTGFEHFAHVSGNLTKSIASTLYIGTDFGNIGGYGYHVMDGATINVSDLQFHGFDRAFYAENAGDAPSITVTSAQLVNNTLDIHIEHPDTTGSFQGVADMDKVIIDDNSTFNIAIQHFEEGSFNISNKLNIRFQNGTITDVSTLILEASTMGIIEGGLISDGGGLTVSIAEGYGYFEEFPDNDIIRRLDWENTSIGIPPNSTRYIYFNSSSILTSGASLPDSRYNILLGRVSTLTSSIEFIDASPINAEHFGNQVDKMLRKAMGVIYHSGSIAIENTTQSFHLDVGAGDYFLSDIEFSPSGGTNINFTTYYQDGISGWIRSATNSVDGSFYDGGTGSLVPLTSSYYAKHSLYTVGDGVNEKYFLVYAQSQYNTLLSAQQADIPTPPSNFEDGVSLIAGIIVQQGTSSIVQIRDQRPLIGFKASGVNASADHGSLIGLLDDDHPQYLLSDGLRTMSGALDLGGNPIVNAGLINGLSIGTHSSRHLPNGLDPLATGTPSTIGTSNQLGIQNSFSRADHIHNIGTGATSLVILGTVSTGIWQGTTVSTLYTQAQVISVSGTTNRITATGTTTSIIDISNAYIGQGSITTLGTITSGTWSGSEISTLYTQAQVINISGTSNRISVTGTTNSVINISTSYAGQGSITTLGTITSGTWSGSVISTIYTQAQVVSISGTTNRISVTGTTNSVIDISNAYIGQGSITTLGTITSGTWSGSIIPTLYTQAQVISVTGTSNRISVTGTTNSTIDISGAYVGQGSITTLGTITSGTWSGSVIPTLYTQAQVISVSGTTNRISVTGTTNSVVDISSAYVGQGSITTLGTITSGTWSGTVIGATFGGTGQTSYVIGDMLYANTTSSLSRLADVATGNALISGGVGVTFSWGKIGLTTHVSGTLPISNGGTGQITASASLNALLPSQTGNSGKFLKSDGTNASWISQDFSNGGEAGGANRTLGNTDAFNLSFKTNNIDRVKIDSAGVVTINNTLFVGGATGGTVTALTELVMQQTGDTYGPSILRLRNRTGENGAIFETTDPTVTLVDFIFKTNLNQRNIRYESRSGSSFIAAPEFQFGVAADPTFVVNDTIALFRKGFIRNNVISPGALVASQNNWNPTGLATANVIRIDATANRTITGIVAQEDGREIILFNVSGDNITLSNESASSTSTNRFALNASIVLAPNESTTIWYDTIDNRWRAIGAF